MNEKSLVQKIEDSIEKASGETISDRLKRVLSDKKDDSNIFELDQYAFNGVKKSLTTKDKESFNQENTQDDSRRFYRYLALEYLQEREKRNGTLAKEAERVLPPYDGDEILGQKVK